MCAPTFKLLSRLTGFHKRLYEPHGIRAKSNVKILGAFAQLRKATISFAMYVCPSAWMFLKFDI